MALSTADKSNLSSAQQEQVAALKKQYAAAQAAGDTAAMNKAHAEAEAIRSSAGYTGGTSGNSYVAKSSGSTGSGSNSSSSDSFGAVKRSRSSGGSLSAADQSQLSSDQQSQIAALKEQYAAAQAAGDQSGMTAAHNAAEAIRATAGYTGGTSGSSYGKLAASQGGQTADQVRQWDEDYVKAGYDKKNGWTNGYSTAMNTRSRANYIRQQMQANSEAWKNAATQEEKDYLHQQNVELAELLGGSTEYDESTGKWGTYNPNVGYGENLNASTPQTVNSWKNYLGYTDEDIEKAKGDSSRYYNFVDANSIRKGTDESSGYTGKYAQFVNGPHTSLMGAASGTNTRGDHSLYENVIGDGFGDEGASMHGYFTYDDNGNIVEEAPELKNNNGVSNYTNQFTDYAVNGVLQPNNLSAYYGGTENTYTGQSGKSYVDGNQYNGKGITVKTYNVNDPDTDYLTSQDEYYKNYGSSPSNKFSSSYGSSDSGSSSGDGYSSYLEQMYAAALESQLESLKNSYDQNISDLDASSKTTDANYTEQKRQATGENAQDAANWREMANAYGLNSGAIGQAALAQNNQLQSDLNTLSSAQAAAQTEIERQRTLLGQQYQSAINEAKANNDYELAQALYNEAVRVEEQLIQQQQYNASLALQYAQMAMEQSQWQQEFDAQYGGLTGSTGSKTGDPTPAVQPTDDDAAVGTGQWYRKIHTAAQNNGQSVKNYLLTNYKSLGLNKTEAEQLAKETDSHASTWGFANNTTDQAYTTLANRLSNSAQISNYTDRVKLIKQYEENGLITTAQAASMLQKYGLTGE